MDEIDNNINIPHLHKFEQLLNNIHTAKNDDTNDETASNDMNNNTAMNDYIELMNNRIENELKDVTCLPFVFFALFSKLKLI